MIRKVFRAGNSTVISLPKDVLEYLGLTEGVQVSIDLDRNERRIIIRPAELPVGRAGVDANFAQQVAEFIEQYRPALEALAR